MFIQFFGSPSFNETYYEYNRFDKMAYEFIPDDPYCQKCVLDLRLNASPKQRVDSRIVYTFFDLIGDIGGVLSILLYIFAFIFSSFSEFSYKIKMFEKLFLVKTTNTSLIKIKSLKKKSFSKNKFKTFSQRSSSIQDNIK